LKIIIYTLYVLETETEYKNCSESIISLEQFENVNSGSMTSKSTNNTLKNQQIVLASDNPLMTKIQNILKLQLLKQKENIKKEILTLVRIIHILLSIIRDRQLNFIMFFFFFKRI